MNPKIVKILSIGGVLLSVAGMVISNVATTQTQKITIAEEVNKQLAELNK